MAPNRIAAVVAVLTVMAFTAAVVTSSKFSSFQSRGASTLMHVFALFDNTTNHGVSHAEPPGSSTSGSTAAARQHASRLERYAAPIVHGPKYEAIIANANLSSWEQSIPGKRACEQGAWHDVTAGSWYNSSKGELFFEPHACLLQRLSADEARKCLSNKTVTFVGDSLSRYQYLSLAHFLSLKQYMQRYADDGKPSLALEYTWPSWAEFYTNSSQQLQQDTSDSTATETCDCHRVPGEPFQMVREFRKLTVEVGSGQAQFNVTLEYQQAFGEDHTRTHQLQQTMDRINRSLVDNNSTQAHLVIVNMGAWFPTDKWRRDEYGVAAAMYQAFFNAPSIQQRRAAGKLSLIWKTTTAHAAEALPGPDRGIQWPARPWMWMLDSMAGSFGWDVLDAYAVTRATGRTGVQGYWDQWHFQPFVYDQLNDVLLNGLC